MADDTEKVRESMEARAASWVLLNNLEAVFSETRLYNLAVVLTEVGDERHREGMEEAAKVADGFGDNFYGVFIAEAIREKIKGDSK
jgi:hypothetical protein